ncbi:MAG: flagellar filament capping protein FliD, partial [Salinisphaeraceae bacterium]|nr:flagellar filament capping protein FliD [Salinisphaeraceae bacterium]
QAATRGQLVGGAAVGSSFDITGANDELALNVNGDITVNLALTQGTYADQQSMLDEIQTQLDANNALNAAGVSVNVAVDNTGKLTFTSSSYGSESTVSLASAENAATFGLDTNSNTVGLDVSGTIGGRAAEGDGQVLYLSSGNGGASGLQVRILGDQTGDRGSITFIQGVGERTVDLVTNMVGDDGALEERTDSINRELQQIQENQIKLDQRVAAYRERLISQFSAADSLISQLNSTRDYVTQQLAALAPQNNRNNN